MSGRLYPACLFGVVVAGTLAGPVLADDGPAASTDANVARLEALLEAQQKQIEALEQQVAAAAQADMNAARVDQMKQQIREILSEKEFRESLMPSTVQAGYDKGFFIKSSDEKFMIKLNGQFQFRWTYYGTRDENRYLSPGARRNDRAGFDWSRLRFRFSGYAYSKDLTYLLELDQSTTGGLDTTMLYAWVNYRIVDEFQIKAGTFRLASTRADFASTSMMQFPEYPMMNAVFGLNRGTGVRLWGKLFQGRGEYYLDVVNSLVSATTQTITTDETRLANGHDNNPAIVFRTIWSILAGQCDHPEDDAGMSDEMTDMAMHTSPAWNVGFHYAYTEDWQDGTLSIPFARRTFFRDGGFGVTSSEGLQIHQFGLDSGFKYQGFSILGEYVIRLLDVRDAAHAPFTPLFLLTGDDSTNAQQGAYVQCGYFLPIPGLERKLEVVGRVGGVSALAGGQEGTWDYGGGLNYYIQGHKVKLQTDVTKVSESAIANPTYSLANVNDDVLVWRVQLQVAF
jgi:hypothetical protein